MTPALQAAARLTRSSPYVAAVTAPHDRAESVARRLLTRYPTAAGDHLTRSAARRLNLPAVTLLVMPPDLDTVMLLLFCQMVPDAREQWHPATGADPLRWRVYELTTAADLEADLRRLRPARQDEHHRPDSITWRLAEDTRDEHRHTITRLVHSATTPAKLRGRASQGRPRPGSTRTTDGARAQLERLGEHLTRLPGLAGIRSDVWALRHHMRRLWGQQHPRETVPAWPHHRYEVLRPAVLVPLSQALPVAQEGAARMEP